MNEISIKTEIAPAEETLAERPFCAVRDRVQALLDADPDLTKAELARRVGVPSGTFNAWLSGEYKGNHANTAANVARGLDAHEEAQRTRRQIRATPGFVMTESATTFHAHFRAAQVGPDMVLIIGSPGTGKTMALTEYQHRTPNVYVVTAEPCISGPRALLREITEAMAQGLTSTSAQALSRAIAGKLRNISGSLLIIDEAQHLTSEALDQLRTIHDKANAGVALVGNATLRTLVEGGNRRQHFAQLYSRIGARLLRNKPRAADVTALIRAWDITDEQCTKLLREIADKPGALRAMTKALRYAHLIADGESPRVDQIAAAYAQLAPADRGTV